MRQTPFTSRFRHRQSRFLLRFFLLILIFSGTTRSGFSQPQNLQKEIRTYLMEAREKIGIPGLAVTIVHRDSLFFSEGFGIAGPQQQPVGPDTPFMLGSLSKVLTAQAVLKLSEYGKIYLDMPVVQVLPDFRLADSLATATLTIRHLLNHRSGLTQDHSFATSRPGHTLAERVALLDKIRPVAPPGERFIYANLNYVILGHIIESVSGTSLQAFLRRSVFRRLEMHHSYCDIQEAREAGLATGYRAWFGFPVAADLDFPADNLPSGHLISSSADMGNFLLSQLDEGFYNDGRALLSENVQLMQTPPPGSPYGMGWVRGEIDGVPALYHGGSLANYDAFMAILPESRYAFIVLINYNTYLLGGEIRRVGQGLVSLLGGRDTPKIGYAFRIKYWLINLAILAVVGYFIYVIRKLFLRWRHPKHKALPVLELLDKTRQGFALDLLSPVVLLIVLPTLVRKSWGAMLTGQPDMTIVLLAALFLEIPLGVFKTHLTAAEGGSSLPKLWQLQVQEIRERIKALRAKLWA